MKYQGKELTLVERTIEEFYRPETTDCALCCLSPDKTGKDTCNIESLGFDADCYNGEHGFAYFEYAETKE